MGHFKFDKRRYTRAERQDLLALIDQVFDLSLENVPVREIASRLSISKSAVHRYIKFAEDRFDRYDVGQKELKRAKILCKLRKLERDLWIEWHRSKLPAESEIEEIGDVDGKPTSKLRKEKRGRIGDSNIVDKLLACWEKEMKLFGLPIPSATDAQIEEMEEKKQTFVKVENNEKFIEFQEMKNASRPS